ncbi:MAG: MlaD family protein [Acidobacteriota bacterium]|nr:MlaD family protein [Acidobacteriota bacterium]
MAQQTKKRWAQLKVGLLAICALALLAFLIFLMTSSNGLFVTRSDVYTFLDDSAAIAAGAPVRLNGITVGRVGIIGLSGSSEPNRIVRVTLQIENRYLPSIPVDSQAAIAAENLLGTKYINIKKGKAQATIMAGAEVKSLDTREFDDVVQQGYSTLASLNGIFKKLDSILDQLQEGKGTIGKLLSEDELYKKVVGIVDETHRVIATLDSQEGTLGKLMHDDSLYTDLRGTLSRVNDLADSIQKGDGTIGKLMKDPALYDDTRATIGDLRGILAGLSQGKGTAGKLLSSDDLHNQIQGTIGRLDTLLDKINNGQGTIGQLLVNPSLYQNLDSTTREINGLMKDFRANPKKFLRIKLGLF